MNEEVKYQDDVNVIEGDFSGLLNDLLLLGMTVAKETKNGSERIDPMSKEGCTVRANLRIQEQLNGLQVGQIVYYKKGQIKNKRNCLEVINSEMSIDRLGWDYKFSAVYKPSPKSQLKNKTPFSKFKTKTII